MLKKKSFTYLLNVILIIVFVLALIYVFVGSLQSQKNEDFNGDCEYFSLNDNWEYEIDGNLKTISFPNKIDYNYGDTLVLTNTIPNDYKDNYYIYLNTNYCSVKAYVDGKEVQVVGINNNQNENPITIIVIPSGSQGKNIDIHITNNGSKFRIEVYSILYGEKHELRFNMVSRKTFIVSMVIAMSTLAIIFFIYSLYLRKRYKSISEDYFLLSIFIVTSIIWILTDFDIQGVYFIGSKAIYLANIFSYFLFPIPLILFVNKQLEKKSNILIVQACIQTLLVIFIMFFLLINHFKLAYALLISHISSFCFILEIEIILIRNHLYNKKKDFILLVGMIILGITGLFTIGNFYFNISNDNTFLYKYGLILFTFLVAIKSIARGIKVFSLDKISETTYMLNKEFKIFSSKVQILSCKYYIERNEIVYFDNNEEKSKTPLEFIKENVNDKYAKQIMDFFLSIKIGNISGEASFEGHIFNQFGYFKMEYELIENDKQKIIYALINFFNITEEHKREEKLNESIINAKQVVKSGGSFYQFNLDEDKLVQEENNLFEETLKRDAKLKDFVEYINKYVITDTDKSLIEMMFSYEKLYSIYGRDSEQTFEVNVNLNDTNTWLRFSIECLESINAKEIITLIKVENVESKKKYNVDSVVGIDKITGLINANSFNTEVKILLEKLDTNKCHTIVSIQMDDIDGIITKYGQAVTNMLVKDMANKLKSITRSSDVIARCGIDKFALFIPYTPVKNGSNKQLITRICEELKKKYYGELEATCSLGVSIYPKDGLTLDKLLLNANKALSAAKSKGNGLFEYYSDDVDYSVNIDGVDYSKLLKPIFNYSNMRSKELKLESEEYNTILLYGKRLDLLEKLAHILDKKYYILKTESIDEAKAMLMQESSLASIVLIVKSDEEYMAATKISNCLKSKASTASIPIVVISFDDEYDIDLYNNEISEIVKENEVDTKLLRSILKVCAKRKSYEKLALHNIEAFVQMNSENNENKEKVE